MNLFISAFVFALVYNAMPGAVFAETVRRGALGGFRPALAVQLGSLSGDALWALLGLAGVGLLLQWDYLRVPVAIFGITYLLYLAWDSWQGAARPIAPSDNTVAVLNAHNREALHSGALISLTNPHNVAFWAAVGSALGALGVQDPVLSDYAIFFAGFMLCSVCWCFVCAAFIERLFRSTGKRWLGASYKLCGLAFLCFALLSLQQLWVSI